MFLIFILSILVLCSGILYFSFLLINGSVDYKRFNEIKNIIKRTQKVGVALVILIAVSALLNGHFQAENKAVALGYFKEKAVVERQLPSYQLWPPKYNFIIKTSDDGFYKVTTENRRIISIEKTSPEVIKSGHFNYSYLLIIIIILLFFLVLI